MIKVIKYEPGLKTKWNDFVSESKNGVFLFYRDYIEYHAERFPDSSYIFIQDGTWQAVLPGCRLNDEFVSHAGLTFGGMITQYKMTTPLMLRLFESFLEQLRADEFKRCVYKVIPHFYHRLPADEDLYALFHHGFKLSRRDVGSVIRPSLQIRFQKRRYRMIQKAINNGLVVLESDDLESYWHILEQTLLDRHQAKPVHSLKEIVMLQSRFPDNIRLFTAVKDNKMLAGTLVYENPTAAHTQYIANTEAGKKLGALDFLFSQLILELYSSKDWISFGISTEQSGKILNEGLIEHKEGFGARACIQDFYELSL